MQFYILSCFKIYINIISQKKTNAFTNCDIVNYELYIIQTNNHAFQTKYRPYKIQIIIKKSKDK